MLDLRAKGVPHKCVYLGDRESCRIEMHPRPARPSLAEPAADTEHSGTLPDKKLEFASLPVRGQHIQNVFETKHKR